MLGGGKAALSFAGLCARRGRSVTVVEPGAVLAPELGPPGRFRLVHETEQLGVRLLTGGPGPEPAPGPPPALRCPRPPGNGCRSPGVPP